MQKTIIVILLLLEASCSVYAQLGRVLRSVDEVEILGGPSLISIRGVEFEDYIKKKVGYTVGIGGKWHIKNRTALKSYLIFERKGFNQKVDVNYFDEDLQPQKGKLDYTWNLNYATIPIVLQQYFDKRNSFFIETGPYFSYLLKGQSIASYSWRDGKEFGDLKKMVRNFDLGLNFFLGYKIPFNDNNLFIEMRIETNYGLIDIYAYSNELSFRNHLVSFDVSVGKNFKNNNL